MIEQRMRELKASIEGPVEWGVDDCTSLAACWVEQETGFEPLRKPFTSKRDAHKIIAEFGGLEKIWEWSLSGILAKGYGDPEYGDVGLVHTDQYGLVGVIWLYGGAALWRRDEGHHFLCPRQSTIECFWSVPHAD